MESLPQELQVTVLKHVMTRDTRLQLHIKPGKLKIPREISEKISVVFCNAKRTFYCSKSEFVILCSEPTTSTGYLCKYWLVNYEDGVQRVLGRPSAVSECGNAGNEYTSLRGGQWQVIYSPGTT